MLSLTPGERRALRARAHHLHAVVTLGDAGLTSAVRSEIDINLRSHELIKIKVLAGDRKQREALMREICYQLAAAAVQHIGRILILYRPRPEDPAPAHPANRPRKNAQRRSGRRRD